jgi:hypothetical protein
MKQSNAKAQLYSAVTAVDYIILYPICVPQKISKILKKMEDRARS